MNREGLATAIEMTQYADAGVCASTQENMLSVGTASLPLLCKTDNKRYKGTVVVTNKVPSGSFRGYGYMESSALVNRAIMRACIGLGLDPVVYYEKNVLRHGERYYNALNQKEPWQYNASPDWKDDSQMLSGKRAPGRVRGGSWKYAGDSRLPGTKGD